MKGYVVKYGDGKWYSEEVHICREDAENELAMVLEDMDHDNWCNLHIEEV